MKKYAALVLALLMVLSLAACGGKTEPTEAPTEPSTAAPTEEPTEEPTEPAPVLMSYAEYAAAAADTAVMIESNVQAKQVYAAEYGNTSLYLQDADGAYFVYRWACTADEYAAITEGCKVRVTGFKSEWAGEPEITDAKVEVIEGTAFTAEAADVTELLGKDELAAKVNQKVLFNELTVEDYGNGKAFAYKNDTAGEDIYYKVSKDGKTFEFTVETDLCDKDSDVYKAAEALKIGDSINVEGFLYWYEGANPHTTAITVNKKAYQFTDEQKAALAALTLEKITTDDPGTQAAFVQYVYKEMGLDIVELYDQSVANWFNKKVIGKAQGTSEQSRNEYAFYFFNGTESGPAGTLMPDKYEMLVKESAGGNNLMAGLTSQILPLADFQVGDVLLLGNVAESYSGNGVAVACYLTMVYQGDGKFVGNSSSSTPEIPGATTNIVTEKKGYFAVDYSADPTLYDQLYTIEFTTTSGGKCGFQVWYVMRPANAM